jgi:methylglutaconyl-CoA hydratase
MTTSIEATGLRLTQEGAVAYLTLCRAEAHNALNISLIQALNQAFAHLAGVPSIRAIVLAAEGHSFCAGADLADMQAAATQAWDANQADALVLCQMLHTIDTCPKPVIARVQGPVYGGGLGLLAVCDVVYAMESVTLRLSEVRLGLVPAVISPFLIAKIGIGPLRRYALTAEPFRAAEAYRLGLVHGILTTPGELDTQIQQTLHDILATAPGAVATCKQLLRTVAATSAGPQRDNLTTSVLAECRQSDEGRAGVQAFLKKNKMPWQP